MRKQIPIKIAAFIILIICSVIGYAGLFKHQGQAPHIEGIFWQPAITRLLQKEIGTT